MLDQSRELIRMFDSETLALHVSLAGLPNVPKVDAMRREYSTSKGWVTPENGQHVMAQTANSPA